MSGAAALASADPVCEEIEAMALRLAEQLMETGPGHAAEIEDLLAEIIDPLYAATDDPVLMLRMLAFREAMRAVTGLPAPKSPAL